MPRRAAVQARRACGRTLSRRASVQARPACGRTLSRPCERGRPAAVHFPGRRRPAAVLHALLYRSPVLKNISSLPRRKARAKKNQQPKILGSRTKRSHTPPVATLRRRGPQIQNNAPQRNEDSKGTRLPNPKADRENCVGRVGGRQMGDPKKRSKNV